MCKLAIFYDSWSNSRIALSNVPVLNKISHQIVSFTCPDSRWDVRRRNLVQQELVWEQAHVGTQSASAKSSTLCRFAARACDSNVSLPEDQVGSPLSHAPEQWRAKRPGGKDSVEEAPRNRACLLCLSEVKCVIGGKAGKAKNLPIYYIWREAIW